MAGTKARAPRRRGRRLTLQECVEVFLTGAMLPPERQPKRKRDAESNFYQIMGHARAQEQLRSIIALNAKPSVVALLDKWPRHEDQMTPVDMGAVGKWWMGFGS